MSRQTCETTLSEVCAPDGFIQTGPFGSQLHMSDYASDGVPVIMPTNLGDGFVVEQGIMRTSSEKADSLSRHKVREGDIVYSRRGDITRRALVTDAETGWLCGTGCLLIRPSREVNSRWLSYWLAQPRIHDWLISHAVGATMLNLNTSILGALPVTLPALPEQQRIAGVLGAFDDLIETNRRLVSNLHEAATAYAAALAEQCDGSVRTFGEVCTVGGGSTPSTKDQSLWGEEHPWATPKDITALPSPFLFDTPRKLSDAGLAKCTSPLRSVGSILMTSRATVGEFALAMVPTAVNQGFIVVNGIDPIDNEWLYFEMRRRRLDFQSVAAKGSTFPEISKREFRMMQLKWPEHDWRQLLHESVSPLLRAAAELQSEADNLIRQRDELLPLLMSGKVRVSEIEGSVP
ncbi:restriction endonuclease subunit S [Acidipropionibacterium timonense]|uniref:restriction endonuclease subunit S n=1 Tax=Acidipropionibacterium timonense TaxID=2161818 RepID=UPI00103068D0|nr:restriction endonuclease subunit S [Acidipropionibacterium timonense]